MSVVKRKKCPDGSVTCTFHWEKDPNFGMINLGSGWESEVRAVYGWNDNFIQENDINIYFPMFDNSMVKSYHSDNGFTFEELMKNIIDIGLCAGEYDTINYPDHYYGDADAQDFLNEYAIVSGGGESGIMKNGTDIYISIEH